MPKSAIARQVAVDMQAASWVRAMFEKGRKLKAEFGADNVQDFTLGNPNASPPPAFFDAVAACAAERDPANHRYMTNAGYDEARAAVARFLSQEYKLDFDAAGVLLTCGAAAAMNVVLRAVLDPGDEVIVLAPFFSEYRFYVEQAQGRLVVAETTREFLPDPAALENALTDRTRAVVVNTPNNPTGALYPEESCREVGRLLGRYDRPDRPLYLICDDIYRRVIYDLPWCPAPALHYPRSIIVSSYSKDLSIPGERLGYVAPHPRLADRDLLLSAMTMLNRTLGFVNAPAFMQRVVTRCADALCDQTLYRQNRDTLCDALRSYGYELPMPGGAFYAFPKSPLPDDAAFIELLMNQHRILGVPGRGFGRPGYFRLSYCVDRDTVERSLPGFKAAIEETRRRA